MPEETLALIECQEDADDPHLLNRAVCSLETAGVIFLDNCVTIEGGPGVRLRRQGPCDEGLHLGELTSENDG
ncbi:DNA-binding protein [Methylobacterium sp. CM6257]